MKLEKIAFLGDCHVPYEDPKAFKLFLKCMETFKPKRLHIMGDFGDFYTTSRHAKDPRRNRDLKWEVDAVNRRLDEIEALDIPYVHFHLGNHCDNLRRYLEEKAPELFNLISVPKLFRFEERGWEWSEYGELVKEGKLYVTHDQDFAGARAHEQTRAAVGHSVVLGHTHRLSINYSSTLVGDCHVAAMVGWLGDPKYATYMKPSKRKDWFQGFGVGWKQSNGVVHLSTIPFIKGVAVVEGKAISL